MCRVEGDRNLRLQFLAGLYLNRYQESAIYREILQRSRFPEDIFTGSPESLLTLSRFLAVQ